MSKYQKNYGVYSTLQYLGSLSKPYAYYEYIICSLTWWIILGEKEIQGLLSFKTKIRGR